MTKKSDNRKLPKEQRQPLQRFRRYDIDMPKEIDERMRKALGATIEKGLLPPSTTERDFLLATVFTNGLAAVEADLYRRERQTSLVVTPQEAAEMAARMPKRG